MRRLSVLFALIAAGAFAAPAIASSSSDQFAEVRARVAEAGGLVDQAVAAAESGDRDRAYDLARTAYLDHFESPRCRCGSATRTRARPGVQLREVPQRNPRRRAALGDPVECRRDPLRAGRRRPDTGLQGVRRTTVRLSLLLHDSVPGRSRGRAPPGDPPRCAGAGRASGYRKPLAERRRRRARWRLPSTWVWRPSCWRSPRATRVTRRVTAVAAVVVLFAVSFWLVSRLDRKHWLEFMRARVASAVSAGSALASPGSASPPSIARDRNRPLLPGARDLREGPWDLRRARVRDGRGGPRRRRLRGLELGRRIPVKPLLTAGASILLLLSVTFAGNAVRSLRAPTGSRHAGGRRLARLPVSSPS